MNDKRFDAVIFDCDGVLVDSEPIANRVLAHMLQQLGLPFTPEDAERTFVGVPMPQVVQHIESLLHRPLPEGWVHRFQEERDAALAGELKAVQGISTALAHLKDAGIAIAVASGANREKVHLSLRVTKLFEAFGPFVFTGCDVQRNKPDPDVYLLAATKLGVPPQRCAVVEDTPTGARAGVAAGMTVFGYCARTLAAALHEVGVHRTFDAMVQLPALLTSGTHAPLWAPKWP